MRFALLLIIATAAWAEPPTSKAVADEVVAAAGNGDAATLARLAGLEAPDPWMVADQLCARGAHDAAAAFALHVGEPLVRFVDRQRTSKSDDGARAVFAAMKEAHAAGNFAKEAELALGLAAPPRTPMGVHVYFACGFTLRRLRRYEESHGAFEVAWTAAQEMGWLRRADAAALHGGLSAAYGRLWPKALDAMRARVEFARALDNRTSELRTRLDIAGMLAQIGRRDEGLASLVALREEAQAAGLIHVVADAWSATGRLEVGRNRIPEGLAAYENALAIYEKRDDPEDVARVRGNIGEIHLRMGSYVKAKAHLRASLETLEGLKDQRGQEIPRLVLATRGNLGLTLFRLEEFDEAVQVIESTLPALQALRDEAGLAKALTNLGSAYYGLEKHAQALQYMEKALQLKLQIGDEAEAAITQSNIGLALAALDRLDASEKAFKAALRRGPVPDTEARCHKGLATTLLAQGRAAEALAHARRGVAIAVTLSRGLTASEAAGRREAFEGLFAHGVLAAMEAKDTASVSWFLEQGRASSLRETIGGGDALERAVVPARLKTRLDEARARAREAEASYRALAGRRVPRSLRQSAREVWRDARERVLQVELAIQRDAKRAAEVSFVEPAELTAIQAALAPAEALVVYGRATLAGDATSRNVGLVVEREGARVVALQTPQDVREAFEALVLDDPEYDPAPALAKLRALLVEPLALGDGVRRLLVSPHGELGYVPFALLAPGRVVAYVPSGTTLLQLQSQQSRRGARVLAVGDPDYRGRLPQLPATRAEVERVGDVTLLGEDATEARLRAALPAEERWRAIHFACHGLVDPVDPSLSSLALTRTDADDGLLTCLDIFGLRTRADLLVLSACETGKGRVYRTEGIVGLTRAFMYAGAPRVLCSLWKVDDAATQALMTKFYELWNPKDGPGLGAAAALKQAQAHVRAQEKWSHPYYWAAWVLWGLAD